MSLNKYMHPRNKYKYTKPNFKALAEKYPTFKQYVIADDKGKAVLDFKNPEAVRALTTCLLQEDFGIRVELPPDRLVPTLPLRLNYVHWIEDITRGWDKKELSGIDIGTGACSVYPILAISGNPWRFLATEADDVNFTYAKKNLESNNLADKISVLKVSENTILEGAVGSSSERYDFCMCNPPFFADHFEAQGLLARTPNRPDPKTMSTASPQEGIVQDGEVGFVRKMIEESVYLQDRVRVYSSMLGKKASLGPLKEILRRHQVPNFSTTEFCQGKTMRWGLAWTFDKSVTFPKSQFSLGKKEVKKSLVHVIPTATGERREHVYDLLSFLKQVFSELQIHCREGKQTKHFALMTLTAAENTWIHSRRKRRQMMREAATASTVTEMLQEAAPVTTAVGQTSSQTVQESCPVSLASPSVTHSASGSSLPETNTEQNTSASVVAEDVERIKNTTFNNVTTESSGNIKKERCDSITNNSNENAIKRKRDTVEDAGVKTEEPDTSEGPAAKRQQMEACEWQVDIVPTNTEQSASSCDQSAPTTKETPLVETGSAADTASVAAPSVKESTAPTTGSVRASGSRPPSQFVLKCHAAVRVQAPDLALELTWLDGADIQLMHQLMQCLKNRLAARKNS